MGQLTRVGAFVVIFFVYSDAHIHQDDFFWALASLSIQSLRVDHIHKGDSCWRPFDDLLPKGLEGHA